MPRKKAAVRTDAHTADRIVEGALRAAEEHGVRRLTMDLIAKYAGLARVTIYGHYANKDAVVAAVVERELARILDILTPIGDGDGDPADRFVDMFVVGFEWLRDHALLQRLIHTEPETILPFAAYDSPYIVVGRHWVAHSLATVFAASADTDAAEDFADPAELIVRVVQSLVLSPVSNYDLGRTQDVHTIARRWLLPIIENASARRQRSYSAATASRR